MDKKIDLNLISDLKGSLMDAYLLLYSLRHDFPVLEYEFHGEKYVLNNSKLRASLCDIVLFFSEILKNEMFENEK